MLTYETISDALLDSAEQVGLNVWQTDEWLDPQTLNRTITLHCLNEGEFAPRPTSPEATIAFKRDVAMTAISTLGTEALCGKYHADNVQCSHSVMGCAYEATLTLEIGYTIPLRLSLGEDVGALQRVARGVRDVHRAMVDHKNIVSIAAGLQLDGVDPRVSQLAATQRWTIGDPIHDLDSLEDVLDEACSEVRDLLAALGERFMIEPLPEPEDIAPLVLPPDAGDDDRVYIMPSSA